MTLATPRPRYRRRVVWCDRRRTLETTSMSTSSGRRRQRRRRGSSSVQAASWCSCDALPPSPRHDDVDRSAEPVIARPALVHSPIRHTQPLTVHWPSSLLLLYLLSDYLYSPVVHVYRMVQNWAVGNTQSKSCHCIIAVNFLTECWSIF